MSDQSTSNSTLVQSNNISLPGTSTKRSLVITGRSKSTTINHIQLSLVKSDPDRGNRYSNSIHIPEQVESSDAASHTANNIVSPNNQFKQHLPVLNTSRRSSSSGSSDHDTNTLNIHDSDSDDDFAEQIYGTHKLNQSTMKWHYNQSNTTLNQLIHTPIKSYDNHISFLSSVSNDALSTPLPDDNNHSNDGGSNNIDKNEVVDDTSTDNQHTQCDSIAPLPKSIKRLTIRTESTPTTKHQHLVLSPHSLMTPASYMQREPITPLSPQSPQSPHSPLSPTHELLHQYMNQSIKQLHDVTGPKQHFQQWNLIELYDKQYHESSTHTLIDTHIPHIELSTQLQQCIEPTAGMIDPSTVNMMDDVTVDTTVQLQYTQPTRFTRSLRNNEYSATQMLHGKISIIQYARTCRDVNQWLNIRQIIIENESNLNELDKYFKYCKNLESLVLHQCKLTDKLTYSLPALQLLDVQQCEIKNSAAIYNIVCKSMQLHTIKCHNSSICQSWGNTDLPYASHNIWSDCLLRCTELEYINGTLITNSIRYNAYLQCNNKSKLYEYVSQTLWFMAINNDPQISSLTSYTPTCITTLDVQRCSLTSIHLYCMKDSLQSLNIASNHIKTLHGSGIHLCKQLQSFDCSYNELSNINDIHILRYCHSLQSVQLNNNKFEPNYINHLLYATRYLPGTNRQLGIVQCNMKSITLDERMNAIGSMIGRNDSKQVESMRWKLHVIQLYGHLQLTTMSHCINTLTLTGCNLQYADVASLINLISLNLSGNKLIRINGLEQCKQLQYIDVKGNTQLSHTHLYLQLNKLSGQLQHISCAAIPMNDTQLNVHIAVVLRTLFYHSPKLTHIEKHRLTRYHYIDAVQKCEKYSVHDSKFVLYKINLSMTFDNTSDTMNRCYTPNTVLPNIQYTYDNIHTLNLQNMQLTHGTHIPVLPNLTHLNLSHNKFKSLVNIIHYDTLHKLTYLDVRNNRLVDDVSVVSTMVNQLTALQCIALANNPCIKQNKLFRVTLINSLVRIHDTSNQLRMIDTLITIDELCTAWEVSQSKQNTADHIQHQLPIFRYNIALQLHCNTVQYNTIIELNLSGLGLTYINLQNLTQLQKLILSDNHIDSLVQTSLDQCTQLVVVDLSHNKLKFIHSLIKILNQLPLLISVSCDSNPYVDTQKKQYRHTLIGGLNCLRTLNRQLQYIDSIKLSHDEIVEALGGVGESLIERELFRYDNLVYHCTSDCTKLELGSSKLQCGLFNRFLLLQYLDIHNNLFTNDMLIQSKLSECKLLTYLDISDNKLNELQSIVALCEQLPKLSAINIGNNPVVIKSHKPRRLFLSYFKHIHCTGFQLKSLNNEPITIDERITAYLYSQRDSINNKQAILKSYNIPDELHSTPRSPNNQASSNRHSNAGLNNTRNSVVSPPTNEPNDIKQQLYFVAEYARFYLTMESMNVAHDVKQLDLRGKKLRLLGSTIPGEGGIVDYEFIETIDLSHNELTRIDILGLTELKLLHTLNLSNNKLHSLKHSVQSLYMCHRLKHLLLHKSTRDLNDTYKVQSYHDSVTRELRGLVSLDSVYSEYCIDRQSPLIRSASEFMYKLAQVGPNTLCNVNISNKKLPSTLFFYTLSALSELQITTLYADGDNEWTMLSYYSDLVLICMGSELRYLDGELITEQRRGLAFKANEKRSLDSHRLLWSECCHDALESVNEYQNEINEQHDKITQLNMQKQKVDAIIIHTPVVTYSTNTAASNTTNTVSTSSNVSGTIISKIEILIHFVQVYAIVLASAIDLHIQWPHVYINYASWLHWLTFDFNELIHNITQNQQYIIFTICMMTPGLMMALFIYCSYLRPSLNQWVQRYVINWKSTLAYMYGILFTLWIVCIVLSFTVLDNNQSVINIIHATRPTSNAVHYCMGLGISCTAIWGVAHSIISWFRKHYVMDTSNDKLTIQHKWLNVINWIQIILLFILTIMYMPIARFILTQFSCTGNFSTNYTQYQCFPSDVTAIQYISLILGFIYIVVYPIFYLFLINRTVRLVMSTNRADKLLKQRQLECTLNLQSYANNTATYDINHVVQLKSELVQLSEQRMILYYNTVTATENFVPSTSLFSAYKKPYRHSKLIAIVQKLLLIMMTLFIPDTIGTTENVRALCGTIIVGVMFLYTIICRPYNDRIETIIDCICSGANIVNVLTLYAIAYQQSMPGTLAWFNDTIQTVLLFVANGAAVLCLVTIVLLLPYTYYTNKRRAEQAELDEENQLLQLKQVKTKQLNKRNSSITTQQQIEQLDELNIPKFHTSHTVDNEYNESVDDTGRAVQNEHIVIHIDVDQDDTTTE